MPQIKVIDSGVFKGFVTINPRWAGFKAGDYFKAARSAYPENIDHLFEDREYEVKFEAGDFDMRGFEITRAEFFDNIRRPAVSIGDHKIHFSMECVRKFGKNNYVEILVNPIELKFAIRPTSKENRSGVPISNLSNGNYYSMNETT